MDLNNVWGEGDFLACPAVLSCASQRLEEHKLLWLEEEQLSSHSMVSYEDSIVSCMVFFELHIALFGFQILNAIMHEHKLNSYLTQLWVVWYAFLFSFYFMHG